MDKATKKPVVPVQDKLVRELVCYLYLQFQKAVPLKELTEPDETGKVTSEMVDSGRRSYGRYIREILACIAPSKEALAGDWYVFYYRSTFYRGDIDSVSGRYGIGNTYALTIAKQILPLDLPWYGYGESALKADWGSIWNRMKRLERTMWLANKIVRDMEREGIGNSSRANLQHFQITFWPRKKDEYSNALYQYCKQTKCRRETRTVQRDVKAVYNAVIRYYETGAKNE